MGSTAVLSGQDADITGIDVVGFQVVDDHGAVSIVAYAAYLCTWAPKRAEATA